MPDYPPFALDAFSLPWEDLDPYTFPLVVILGKVVVKLKNYCPDCSRVAQHALVRGSGSYVKPNPTMSAPYADSTHQSDSTQEFGKPESPCLASRVWINQSRLTILYAQLEPYATICIRPETPGRTKSLSLCPLQERH